MKFVRSARRGAPSKADAVAQIDAYRDHHLYNAARHVIEERYATHGGWEAAAFATELAEFFEEHVLRQKLDGIAKDLI